MSRLPIPHFINQIKTKLGFDRALTASGEDVVDAVNKQSQQIDDQQDAITPIKRTGTSNTGTAISKEKYFWLDNVLCIAIAQIGSGAQFTNGSNYVPVLNGFLDDTGWIQLDTTYNTYYRQIGKVVYIKGKTVIASNWLTIGTLPANAYPASTIYKTVIAKKTSTTADDRATIAILPDGAIQTIANIAVNFQESFILD